MSTILTLENQNNEELQAVSKTDYSTLGFIDAGKVAGSPFAFLISLEKFYSDVIFDASKKKHDSSQRQNEIEAHKKSIEEKIKINKNEIEKIKSQFIPQAEKDLTAAEKELNDFNTEPEKFLPVKKDKLMYVIWGILSVTLFLFLFIFYSSVVYSALFREITIDKNTLFYSIFYPRSFEESFSKGLTSFLLVFFAPFLFVSFGTYLESIKNKTTKKINIGYWVFMGIIFLVDSLLAFHISERIHNSKVINSFGAAQPYYFYDALTDANYWMIIVLGFLVYFIFGKIFSLFNEHRTNKNKFDNYQNLLMEKVEKAKSRLAELKNEIINKDKEISNLSFQITDLHPNQGSVFYSPFKITKIISEYALGWIKYLTNADMPESHIVSIKTDLDNFILKKGLNNDEN